ncbi:hypothetical protein K2X05_09500 [bacterium]|nr:hypothetical protein [bacterium]
MSIIKIFILFFIPHLLWAEELPEYNLSVKGLGMGNAYTGHARGHDGIFYNPASIANFEGFQFRLMGLGVGLNGLDVYNEYKDIFNSADTDMAAALNALYGQPIWARLDYQMSISAGPFVAGAYFRNNLGFTLQNPALPYLDANFYSDMVLFGGMGVQLIPKIFEVGLVAKRITRYAGSGDITASTLAYLDSNVLEGMSRTGVAYGADFGAKLTLPGDWHPSAAFAWQDIGDTSFSFSSTTPAPETIKDRMNVALGLEREFMGVAKLRPALEYKMDPRMYKLAKKFIWDLNWNFLSSLCEVVLIKVITLTEPRSISGFFRWMPQRMLLSWANTWDSMKIDAIYCS